jgi:hypothetical protein
MSRSSVGSSRSRELEVPLVLEIEFVMFGDSMNGILICSQNNISSASLILFASAGEQSCCVVFWPRRGEVVRVMELWQCTNSRLLNIAALGIESLRASNEGIRVLKHVDASFI